MAKKYLSLERLQEYDALIKAEIAESDESTLSSAKSYTNTEISKITNGTTVIPEAEHSSTSDSATHADSSASADVATKANQLSAARTISLTGDASGSVSFDGSKDVSITVTVTDDSHNHVISNIDGLQTALDGKAPSSHSHDDRYYTETEVDTLLSGKSDSGHNHDAKYDTKGAAAGALADAKTYADNAATKVKNDLLNGAGTAYDTLKELGDLIDDNQDAIEALETVASGKADAVHSHAIADVTGLQSALDGKAAASHGTHVTFDSTNKPKMDGTAAFGTSTKVARADHVHPTDTSRASKTEFDTHVSDTTKHITSTERTNWNAAKTHADSAHAPSNAEKNVIVGIQKNGTDLTVNSSTRKVNITVPTTAADIGAAPSSHTHAISDITNLQTTLNNASSAISANTSSIDSHTTKITALENKVGDGFAEITSAEIQALFA